MKRGTESTASIFADYQRSVAGRLRYILAQRNVEKMHCLSRPLRVLDAAGGNGLNTEYYLRQGHSVTLFDSNPDMLEQARLRLGPLLGRCQLVEGHLEQITERLAAEPFDLILCHHALEYLRDGLHVLKALCELAAPAGELSLITLNPVSEVIRPIIFRQDPALAIAKLTDFAYDARWFGQARLYPFEQVIELAAAGGWRLRDFRAIRVLSDYVPEEAVSEDREQKLLSLEEELSGLEPYRRIGRYTQFCFDKQAGQPV
jgi:S-adenosylmethionine-dependent methyltransferase